MSPQTKVQRTARENDFPFSNYMALLSLMTMLHKIIYYFKRHTTQSYKPVVLVTGCASGIGLALAEKLYCEAQYRVVITAREKHLKTLRCKFPETDRFLVLGLDVTLEKERQRVIQEIDEKWGGVDILINNAGISYRSVVEHMTEQDEIEQMKVNYLGPMGLIRLAMPRMRQKGRGKIINVSSVSGMLAMPTMASYSASKFALEGASEALWYEAKIMGINVSLIQPGFIKSNSFQNVYYPEGLTPDKFEGPYHDLYQNMAPFVEKMMKMSPARPERIAKIILKIVKRENPPLWVPATPDAFLFYYLRRLLPRKWLLPVLFWGLPNSKIWGEGYSNKRQS